MSVPRYKARSLPILSSVHPDDDLVLASDYDALQAELAERIAAHNQIFDQLRVSEDSRNALSAELAGYHKDSTQLISEYDVRVRELEAELAAAKEILFRPMRVPYDPATYAAFYDKWMADRNALFPQPVWWSCICGATNSLDTCGNCHRSRLD